MISRNKHVWGFIVKVAEVNILKKEQKRFHLLKFQASPTRNLTRYHYVKIIRGSFLFNLTLLPIVLLISFSHIKLEQYTRRENLRFNNINEEEEEDCRALIYDILQRDLELNTTSIKFHAVHRVGKIMEGRTRPIIVRFVSREDRNLVWAKRGKIKQSTKYTDAYITEDFARAIQEERKVLIKAMFNAKGLGVDNAKVIGRYLIIDNQKYDFSTIPTNLK